MLPGVLAMERKTFDNLISVSHRKEAIQMLQKIDDKILAYWDTAPNERVWAYLATFVPLLGIMGTMINAL